MQNSWYNSYNLNQVISTITRFNTPNLTEKDLIQLTWLIEDCSLLISKNNWDIVNFNQEHKEVIQTNVEYAISICNVISNNFPNHKQIIWKLLEQLNWYLTRLMFNKYSLAEITKDKISAIFWFEGLFDSAQQKLKLELWKRDALVHPDKSKLFNQISMNEVQRITNFAVTQLFNVDIFPINFYKDNDFWKHIIYWNKTQKWVNYVIPPLTIEQYLSFDLPHNTTHLLHLYNLWGGVESYVDELEERCFFEALAVLSEHLAVTSLSKNKELSHDLFWCLNKENQKKISKDEFQNFIVNDRKFEFRLRAVRLIADILLVNGYSYHNIVQEVMDIVWVNQTCAENEIKKYIAQPWLWAIYILWYNKMLALDVTNPAEVINIPNPPKTWNDFLTHKLLCKNSS